ncbi:MAG: dockerin type I domain-containing protein, partial [Ruminococcus sp.]
NDNQDTGLQISRYNTSDATIADWPSYNLILNCTAKNNCDDATMENADGFAAKLTCGEGNVFDGCMSYNNSDDGWDLFAKSETGPIGIVTIQNCIAFRNGFTEFGEGYGDCDGNGFKLGGSGIGSPHVVKNSLAFENLNCGFTDNNNPKLGTIIDCTAMNNGGGGNGKPNFSCYRCTDPGCDFDNLMSYYDSSVYISDSNLALKIANDKYVGTYANGVYYNSGYYKVDADTAVDNGDKIGTKFDGPTASDFISMAKAPAQGTDFHTAWRNADGSLNPGGLYETTTNGTYATMGYHMYNGTSPIVTTTTTGGSGTVTTTTTVKTTSSSSVTPSGAQIHNFTENGTESTFYTITGNLSTGKGTVTYNGLTLTQCLKLESATSIGFTNTADGTLTLVFVEPAATINVDGTKYTASGDGIITVPVTAGTHSILKADTANLFYMVYADEGGTVTTTSATTATTTATTTKSGTTTTKGGEDRVAYGDTNLDGVVDLRDAISMNKYLAGLITWTSEDQAYKNADVNANGTVNEEDGSILVSFVINLIDALPQTV